MRTPRATKMWVVTVDENGKETDGRCVKIPEPDSFVSDGFAQIEGYISRLLQSSARFTSVMITTPDGQTAVSLWQRTRVPEFSLQVGRRSESEREQAVRQFFSVRGLSTSQDYLAGNGGVPDATRCLVYLPPPDAQFITSLTKDVLREIYHIGEGEALNFTFQEHDDAV